MICTKRELEILELLARGQANREIADNLYISYNTERTHVRNALQKLEAHNSAHAIAIAISSGMIKMGSNSNGSD